MPAHAHKIKHLEPSHEAKKRVLTQAVLRLAASLILSRQTLSIILGVSEPSLSRLYNGSRMIDPATKEGEIALILIQIYRSLDSLLGGDETQLQLWIQGFNQHLGGVPANLMQTLTGLSQVTFYLDEMVEKINGKPLGYLRRDSSHHTHQRNSLASRR